MELSIVTTLYHSAAFLPEFYARASAAAQKITPEYELILVNDGSPDNSLEVALGILGQDSHVQVIDLSRNFGHHPAIIAGLSQSCGARVFLLDVDLEEAPEWLELFWNEMNATDADVVFGVQEKRRGKRFKRVSGGLFYKLFNLLSDTEIPENLMTVRLMRREYVDALLHVQDKNLYLAGTMAWTGFRQKEILLEKQVRASRSTYSLPKMLNLSLNAITSFSSYPLRLVFFTGVIISALAGASGLYMLIDKLLNPQKVLLGYASIIVSLWFLGGLIILFLGIIGIYLSKIFIEVKNRPLYIIRRLYEPSLDKKASVT